MTLSSKLGIFVCIAALVASAPTQAGEIQVIFSEVDGHPTSQVPGALDLAGNPIVTEFKALEDLTFSPDGSMWIVKARNEAGSDLETMLLIGSGTSGMMLAQEGQPVAGGVAGELYDFFDASAGFTSDATQFAFGARARGGDSSTKEKVIKFDGANFTIIAQESDAANGLMDLPPAPSGDETFGNSLNSIHLLDDGRVGFVAVTINDVHSSRRPALFYDNDAFLQSGVSPIGSDIWDSFDSDDFRTTQDGMHWFAQGDDEGSTATDDLLAVDGVVVLREGDLIPSTSITVDGIFFTKMLPNGDWYSRGDDPANDDWAVSNGELFAATGNPITPGSPENWGDSFLAFTGNNNGDWVLVGNTDSADTATDTVIVLNGRDVVVREGDPVDLDGNGIADDDAFIGRGTDTSSAFNPNDIFLSDDGMLYFFAPLRDSMGNDLGIFGSGGDSFLCLDLPSACASGNVDLANGTTQDALQIDGSSGYPTRSTTVSPSQSFSLSLDAANAGPVSGRYVVWAWIGEGTNPTDLMSMGQLVGCTVNPTPIQGAMSPQPQFCLPGMGIPAFVCAGTNTKNVSDFAPWMVTRPSGLANPITITLQGLLEDDSTPHPQGFSMTNAVKLVVQ